MTAAALVGAAPTTKASVPAAAGRHASPKPRITPKKTVGRMTGPDTDWPTYDHSASRAGVSTSTPRVRSAKAVRRGWTVTVDGDVYAQPLVVGNHIIVATENDSVYAIDKYTGQQLWRRHLASPVPGGDLPCGDINPSGITGTPVADVATDRLFVVTFTVPLHHTLWTLDLTTGHVETSRTIDGPGDDPRAEQQRSALAIDGSKVFVAYGGLDGDCSDYHGWVVGAPLRGKGKLIHYVTPTQREAGIWSPPGPAVGAAGLYVATGNGSPVSAVDNSDSVIRLSSKSLKVESTFTPSNYVYLSSHDLDLGTTSPALLPHNNLFMIGKEGVGYVLGAVHLGGLGHPLATKQICSGGFGGDAVIGNTVVVSCFNGLYAVRVSPGSGSKKPTMRVLWTVQNIQPGPPVIAGGIVWDVTRGNQLIGVQASNGHAFFATSTAPVVTSFPSLSASAKRLFVPEGDEVVSYKDL